MANLMHFSTCFLSRQLTHQNCLKKACNRNFKQAFDPKVAGKSLFNPRKSYFSLDCSFTQAWPYSLVGQVKTVADFNFTVPLTEDQQWACSSEVVQINHLKLLLDLIKRGHLLGLMEVLKEKDPDFKLSSVFLIFS